MTHQRSILIVDDNIENIKVLSKVLEGEGYRIRVATNGEKALESLAFQKADIVLLDVLMPGMDGYEVCQRLKEDPHTKDIPVVFLTALSQSGDEKRGLSLGAIDYIAKPFNIDLVKTRVRNILKLKSHQDILENTVEERTKELRKTQNIIIETLGIMAEFRDTETGEHIRRTVRYVKMLLEYVESHFDHVEGYEIYEDQIELILRSAPLHDIGKVAVPDHILLKKGKLTEDEMTIMKEHTTSGAKIISSIIRQLEDESFLRYAREIALTHHERWDGKGYPQGLKEREIPITGRIMSIADVYDALRAKRVYKPAFSHEEAVKVIRDGRGTQFDPLLVDAFMTMEKNFEAIASKFKDKD